MGFFGKREKEYKFSEIVKLLQTDRYKDGYIVVPTSSGKYCLMREDKNNEQLNQDSSLGFKYRRENFMNEVTGNGKYVGTTRVIGESYESKKGRVIPSYNNWQGTRKYSQGNIYGQYR